MKNILTTDRVSGLLGILLSVVIGIAAIHFPERAVSASIYVKFLSVSLGLCSLVLFIKSCIKDMSKKQEWISDPKAFLQTIISMIVYILLIQVLGFFISSFILMIVLGRMLGYKKKLQLVLVSGTTLAFIYLVFVVFLTVPVPTGLL